ncbi:cation diffusion facilitator family transporter [Halobacteriaceae archaeon GCM10025711]
MADHDHGGGEVRSLRPLAVAFAINTAFLVVEFAGAVWANSLTLLADAAHMLTDSASLLLALAAAWVAARPADARRTYGYQRAEVLGALANGVFLLAVVGYIVFDAVQRFQDPEPVRPLVVVGVGVLGLAANLAAAGMLAGDRENLNVRGAFIHLLADAAGSVAAIVVGLVLAVTDWYVLDPAFAVVVAALVLYSTFDLLRDSVNILLQGTPRDVDLGEVRSFLAGIEGVVEVHDVHVWALSASEYSLSAHVVVAEDTDGDAVLRRCQATLGERFGIDHATIQVESPSHVETTDVDCYSPPSES